MCFRFLKCLARGYPVVQQRLFNRMRLLMRIENVEAEMADLFIEVVCDSVKKDQESSRPYHIDVDIPLLTML